MADQTINHDCPPFFVALSSKKVEKVAAVSLIATCFHSRAIIDRQADRIMEVEQFCIMYPELYHMSEPGALPSILEYGLLSTSTLLNLFEIDGEARRRLESQVRRESQTISHAKHGSAVVRDQKPIVNEERLRKCVQGAAPEEWLRLLNSKVFFWVNRARLNALRSARAYRGRQHLLLTLNTRKLVTEYLPSITLCPMNSGNCLPYPHPRSPACFASIQDFDYAGWRAKRGGREIVVECAVDGSVKNVERYLLRQEIV